MPHLLCVTCLTPSQANVWVEAPLRSDLRQQLAGCRVTAQLFDAWHWDWGQEHSRHKAPLAGAGGSGPGAPAVDAAASAPGAAAAAAGDGVGGRGGAAAGITAAEVASFEPVVLAGEGGGRWPTTEHAVSATRRE